MAELIFLSHANVDKRKIVHIVDRLIVAGFRLFIDHPEKIDEDRFTETYCRVEGIETLWSDPGKTDWSKRLAEMIEECACVLVIVSEALSVEGVVDEDKNRLATHRMEWKAEIMRGDALHKIAFAKIGSFVSGMLPSYVRGEDAIDLTPTLSDAALTTGFDILVRQRIIPAIKKGRAFRPVVSSFRELHELLPLCVGRRKQRRAIIDSLRLVRETGRINPVIVMGPENELPRDFVDALPHFSDERDGKSNFLIRQVDWPDGAIAYFAEDFRENLADGVCLRTDGSVQDVIQQLRQEGHPAIIQSRRDVSLGVRSVDAAAIAEWLGFWRAFNAQSGNTPIVPVLSLLLSAAAPGWAIYPPCDATSDEWRHNKAQWDTLEQARKPGETEKEAFLLPPITPPIVREHAQRWAGDIHEEMLGRRRRDQLLGTIDDQIFREAGARRDGVNHENFRDAIRDWFDTA